MSGNKIFVDTNILLYLLKGDSKIKDILFRREIVISFISEIELLSFPFANQEEDLKVKNMLTFLTIIESNKEIKENTISVRKDYKMKLPDSMILATAEYCGLSLFTADKGFKKAENHDVVIYEF